MTEPISSRAPALVSKPVWDLPLRLFHWLMALVAIAAFVTAELGGNWMVHHGRLGVLMCGLIAFRLTWGLIGTRTARFVSFVRGPGAILAYLRGRWLGIGHNPLGALSVLALLGAFGLQALGGLFSYDDIAFEGPLRDLVSRDFSGWVSGLHRDMYWVLIGLVAVHLMAIAFYRVVHRDNLVSPMLTGRKALPPDVSGNDAVRRGALVVALVVAAGAMIVASGVWISAPPPPPAPLPAW